jgi:hypothetical protein
MVRILRLLVIGGALLMAAAAAFAQEAAPGQTVPRRILLTVARPEGSSFTAADAFMIGRSLLERLQGADAQLVMVEAAEESTGRSPDELGAQAKDAGADGWMQVTLDGAWSAAKLGIRSFDLLSNAAVAELSVTRTAWGNPSGLVQEGWTDVVQAIAGKFPPVEAAAPVDAGQPQARLTVTALPGSVVTGLGKASLRIEADGSASAMLPVMREYMLRTTLAGFTPVTQRVFLSTDREVRVDQKKSSQWGVELSLLDAQAPGVDLTMAMPANSLFVRLGFSTYAVGLALTSTSVLTDDPLTNIAIQAGVYLGPEDRLFRLYLALGVFARVVHVKDTAPVLDQMAPLGLRFMVGSELPGPPQGRFFFEYTPTLYSTSVPDLFRAALGQNSSPGWIFGHTLAASLISFRFGYRWQL